MYTPGEVYLDYIGLPDDYPRTEELTRHLDHAIFEAVEDVMADWKRRDPVLRVMADERCTPWMWATVPAGILPIGTLIHANTDGDIYRGRLRPQTDYEREWYPNRLGVHWIERVRGEGRYYEPEIEAGTRVEAYVPVPFDLSALLATIDSEIEQTVQAATAARQPRPRRRGTRA